MKQLSKYEAENELKVGDEVAVVSPNTDESSVREWDTISEIIKREDGSVKLRLQHMGTIRSINRISGRCSEEKPHLWKSHFSSSRMTKSGLVHVHASGCNYQKILVKR